MKNIPLRQVHSFETETGTQVTKRIEKGITKVFQLDERDKASAYAKKKRSYFYDLFCNITVNQRPKTVQYGYAVPN